MPISRIASSRRRMPPSVNASSVICHLLRTPIRQHIYNRTMPPDQHEPLRDDVRLLGDILGRTLRERAGESLLFTVERVRALAKAGRHGHHRDLDELSELLRSMTVEDAVPVARAFSHFLTLANIAEQHHRVRRRRAYQRDPSAPPQQGSFRAT